MTDLSEILSLCLEFENSNSLALSEKYQVARDGGQQLCNAGMWIF